MKYTVKDCFHVKGLPVTHGTDMPYFTLNAPHNCAVIDLLRDEFVGISGATPFACGNVDFTRQIHGKYAGGSSSGGAKDIVEGRCDYSIGTDVGGSCRTPALRAGLVGFKASADTIPREGMYSACARMESVGIMAKDCLTILHAYDQVGRDEGKAWSHLRVIDPTMGVEDPLYPLLNRISAAWLTQYAPEFFSNTLTFNGVFHRYAARQIMKPYRQRSTHGRDALPVLVRARILAGAVLALERSPQSERACERYRAQLERLLPGDCLILTPGQPQDLWRDQYDDRYLLLANVLDRPALTLPLGPRGLQLIGPKGSQRNLLQAGLRIMHQRSSP